MLAFSAANAALLYSEDFEAPLVGWSMSGLWHVTSNFPAGGSNALGYVQGETMHSATPNGNYNTGSTNFGTAYSAAVSLPSAGPTTLKLQAFNHNEFGNDPNNYDILRVGISTDGGASFTILTSTSPNDSVPTFAYWTGADVYQNLSLDLSAYNGQTVRLAFSYDTVDGAFNNHPGARIDNIMIDGTVPEPSSVGLACLSLACLGLMQRIRRA